MSSRASIDDRDRDERRRGWSVAARTTWWFGLTTAALVLAICAISGVFLTRSTEHQIDALLDEELDEFKTDFNASSRGLDDAKTIAAELQARHATTPMAWRVWDQETHAVWAELGRTDLLTPAAPALEPLKKAKELSSAVHWRSAQVTPRYVAGLILDGSSQMKLLREFGA